MTPPAPSPCSALGRPPLAYPNWEGVRGYYADLPGGLNALLERVRDGHHDQHGAGGRDPGDQRKPSRGDGEDRERRERQWPRKRDVSDRLVKEEDLGEIISKVDAQLYGLF